MRFPRPSPALLALPVAFAAWIGASRARANGAAVPDTAQFHSQSPTAGDWVMNTTFGFLFSADAGTTWHWSCHEAVIGTVSLTPKSYRSPGGELFVAAPLGLATDPTKPLWRTTDDGCHWTAVASLTSDAVLALAFDSTGTHAIAAGSNAATDTALAWLSSDGGATFSAPVVSRAGRFFTSALVAPSNAQRLYLTAFSQSPAYASVLRSDDGGANWNEYVFPFQGQPATRLLAISPTNADVVWLRNDAASDRVLVSTDGAITFTERLTLPVDVVGFALTGGGNTAWVAARSTAGLYTAAGTAAFARLPAALSPRCLDAQGNTLFVCSNPYVDPFGAGTTTDGAAFTTAMTFGRVIGPVSCPSDAGSSGPLCDSLWPGVDAKIHGSASPSPTPTGNPGSGGGKGGCGCDLAGGGRVSLAGIAGALAALLAIRRGARRGRRAD